jgi:enamine deaminase RidA (YjgF/YER057c/UK114 family)
MAVKDEFMSAPYPAWTAVGTPELFLPGALVEIQVTARRP